MKEQELLKLCRPGSSPLRAVWRYLTAPFWTGDVYGFGKHIREYGYFPDFLPLCIYTDHGPSSGGISYKHELESNAPVQFYHSPVTVARWKQMSRKPCYVLFSPFVFYRRENNIIRSPDAMGTLAYPAHSTPQIDDESDIEAYIAQLQALPAEYHPISVNLHYHDIIKGQHRIFQRHNITVYSAGHPFDHRYTQRFYDVLKHFKYTTSNFPMSCLFYSVEMGIPHFIYGNAPVYINRGDPNLSPGRVFESPTEYPQTQKLWELFCGMSTAITPAQADYVESELGLRDGVGRLHMAAILYGAFFKSIPFLVSRVLVQVWRSRRGLMPDRGDGDAAHGVDGQ